MDIRWQALAHRPNASHNLFCFPFSGGAPTYFRYWAENISSDVEVRVLDTPGKGARCAETPYDCMEELVEAILKNEHVFRGKQFSFFGHSMGARVAVEACWQLKETNAPMPNHLFISASLPPAFNRLPPFVHTMTDDDLIEELRVLGGTPDSLLEDRNFIGQFLRGIRADFKILEMHRSKYKSTLPVDISIWSGQDDPRVPASLMHFWSEISHRSVRERFFPGGHMFIDVQQSGIACLAEMESILGVKQNDKEDQVEIS